MPAENDTRPAHWPPRWVRKHGAIYYRVPAELSDRWNGKSWFRLGSTDAEAWVTWHEHTAPRKADGAAPPETLGAAMTRYIAEELPKKTPKTQKEYLRSINLMRPVFGAMRPSALKPRHVYQFMDHCPPVAANRHNACLSAIVSCCVRWGAIDRNLVREVKRNTERPRDRYVEDRELEAFVVHCNPMLRAYVNLKLLTGLRQGQILGLRRSDWNADDQRLTVKGAKKGKTIIYGGPGLKEAIYACLALQKSADVASVYVLANRDGARYTSDGFRSIWQRAMAKYIEAGGERFTEHDLRAKVASDSESLEAASNRLGHQQQSTTKRVYHRKPVNVTVLDRGESHTP